MTRCLLRSIITVSGEDSEALYLQNAEVNVFRTGTTALPVMFAGPTGGSPIANPILSNSNGEIVVWLDETESNIIDIMVDSNGGLAYLANQPSKRQGFATFTKTLQAGGPQGTPGTPGSPGLTVQGTVTTSSALPGSASVGDLWVATDTEHAWIWTALPGPAHWVDSGPIVGPPGDPGPPGSPGVQGATGITGTQGPTGTAGTLGYVENGSDTTLGAATGPTPLVGGGLGLNFALSATTMVQFDWGALVYHTSATNAVPELLLYLDGTPVRGVFAGSAVANQLIQLAGSVTLSIGSGSHEVIVQLAQSYATATAHCWGSAPADPAFLRAKVA